LSVAVAFSRWMIRSSAYRWKSSKNVE